jgi:predicted RNase H-like HicB family nuclease
VKKFKQYLYPAIFVLDEDGKYQVIFPDLQIFTDGKDLSEAYLCAKELLRVYFSYVNKYEVDYNLPTKLEELEKKCKTNEKVLLVDAFVG